MPNPNQPAQSGPLFGTNYTFRGIKVQVHLGLPRYVMPEWLIPGVLRWPDDFRRETNEWARKVCGRTDLLEDGVTVHVERGMVAGAERIIMNQTTFERLRAAGELRSRAFHGADEMARRYLFGDWA